MIKKTGIPQFYNWLRCFHPDSVDDITALGVFTWVKSEDKNKRVISVPVIKEDVVLRQMNYSKPFILIRPNLMSSMFILYLVFLRQV